MTDVVKLEYNLADLKNVKNKNTTSFCSKILSSGEKKKQTRQPGLLHNTPTRGPREWIRTKFLQRL